jgi:hypothetical protein
MSQEPMDFEIQADELVEFIGYLKRLDSKSVVAKKLLDFVTMLWGMGDEDKNERSFDDLNGPSRMILMHSYGKEILQLCRDPAPDPRPPTREPST